MNRHPCTDTVTKSSRFLSGRAQATWHNGRLVGVELLKAGANGGDKGLARDLDRVWRGRGVPASLKFSLGGVSDFSAKVMRACARIPWGEVRTYGELAAAVGRPQAARAVGQVMARNPFPVLIPCHRVLASGRRLNGFAAGLDWKADLLAAEGWQVEGGGRHRKVTKRRAGRR